MSLHRQRQTPFESQKKHVQTPNRVRTPCYRNRRTASRNCSARPCRWTRLENAAGQRRAAVLAVPSEAAIGRDGAHVVSTDGADVALFWGGVLAQHEHGLSAFLVELLEEDQGSLVETQTALLVAVHNVQRVLPPVGGDVVFLERDGQDLVAGVVDGHAEGFEDLDLGVGRGRLLGARRGLQVVGAGAAGQRGVSISVVWGGGGCGVGAHGPGRQWAGGCAGVAAGGGLFRVPRRGPALCVVVVLVGPRYLGAGVLGASDVVCRRGGRGLGDGVGGHLRAGAQRSCEV